MNSLCLQLKIISLHKTLTIDLTKLLSVVRENYNIESIKIYNYEYIQIKPKDNREVTDDFLYEVIKFLG